MHRLQALPQLHVRAVWMWVEILPHRATEQNSIFLQNNW